LLTRCGRGVAQQNPFRRERESLPGCTTRLLRQAKENIPAVFRTVVIDEAHFLKNLNSYWGLGAGLLGLHAERVIPMSGTPYNNGPQDIATLMTFIDPSLDSALEKWWKDATKDGAATHIAQAVSKWNQEYMTRREKSALSGRLTKKIILPKIVAPYPLELVVYEQYELKFLQTLDKFSALEDDNDPETIMTKKKLFQLMLSAAACMVRNSFMRF